MKKVRVILAMSAALLVIGGVFATNSANIYYQYIPAGGGDPEQCVAHSVDFACSTAGTVVCALPTTPPTQLRQNSSTATDCGAILFRN